MPHVRKRAHFSLVKRGVNTDLAVSQAGNRDFFPSDCCTIITSHKVSSIAMHHTLHAAADGK